MELRNLVVMSMGVLRVATVRGILRFLAVLLSMVTGIIIARKLDPSSYALYQIVTKRVTSFSALPSTLASFWAYRYSAMGIHGVAKAHIVMVGLSSVLAFSIALLLIVSSDIVDTHLYVLASLAACTLTFYAGLHPYAIALRPVFSEITTFMRRCVYAALVVLLVYIYSLKALGALTALTISSALGIATLLYGVRRWLAESMCRRCIAEWLRGAYLPLLNWFATFLSALDVVIVLMLIGSYVVAAFFAITLALSIVMEVSISALQHLTAYILRTGDVTTGLRISRLMAFASAMLCGYAMARPESIVALVNPIYIPSASALRIYAIGVALTLITSPLAQTISGTDRAKASRPGRVLIRLSIFNLIASAIYIATLSSSLSLFRDPDPVMLWVLAFLVWRAIGLAFLLSIAGESVRVEFLKGTMPRLVLFLTLSYTLSSILARGGYELKFIHNLYLLASNVLVVAVPYIAISIAIDPELRFIVRKLLTTLYR